MSKLEKKKKPPILQYTLNAQLEEAKAQGLEIVQPKPNELLLDLDSQQDGYVMDALLPILRDYGFAVTISKVERSRHGNKHAYLVCPRDITELERIALQACLGSDRKRELLGLMRVFQGITPVSVLFRKKDAPQAP